MNLDEKKIKCLKCEEIVIGKKFSSEVKGCKCGSVVMRGDVVLEAVEGKDYVNVSAVLLNENV